MKIPVAHNPGKVIEEALLARNPQDRPRLLAHLERRAKELGDLEIMRGIKEYREASRKVRFRI